MKKYLYFLHKVLFLLGSCVCAQQISVDTSISVQQLVETNLATGCVEITNISSQINGSVDNINSFGSFQRSSSSFPFENGFVLTTGNANEAGNTLNTDLLNDGSTSWGTDSDLENALGVTNTLNATSIEFDFISISNTLQFNYIYASEEYFALFPCSYTDRVVFLIREAGTSNPYRNMAVIPGTNTPVSSVNIHDTIDGADGCSAENDQFFDGFFDDTNYNGRTTVLTATENIVPNIQYHIKLIIADQDFEDYDSAVFIEANSFNSIVDLGEDFSTCTDSVILNADINNSQATYRWFLNGGLISGEEGTTYEVMQSGTYTVEIDVPLAGSVCTIEDTITLDLSNTQSSAPMSDIVVCDDLSNDGEAVFNLNTKDNEAISSVAAGNYNVTYHLTSDDAINNNNPVSGNYTNIVSPETIYVRIEETDTGCLAFNEFQLVVNARPIITQPSLLLVCDDETIDGFTAIDLSSSDDEITNGNSNLVVNYHTSQQDAETGQNPLPLPYVNDSVDDMVFVSVTNNLTGCITTTTLDITVIEPPIISNNQTYYIDACDRDLDGFATFDLTDVENDILNGATNVNVSYHLTPEDALSGSNPIANPTNFANTEEEEQIIYIRVEDISTGCPSIAPFEIHTNLLLTGTTITDFSLCDIDNDGTEEFNFNNIETVIVGDIQDVTIIFYETEDDRDNGINPIDVTENFIPVSFPQEIFITLTSPTCEEVGEFELFLNEIVDFPNAPQQSVCDEDQDGFTTVDLSLFDSVLFQNEVGFDVSYFESEADALSNINPVDNFYTNTTNPYILYARISSVVTGCPDVSNIEILVNAIPSSNTPSPIVICDDDLDGQFIVNLEDTIPEMIGTTPNLNITFYTTQDDAIAGSNIIINPNDYNAQTSTLFARVENEDTNCFTTQSIEIIINTLPILETLTNYEFCENNTDNVGDFLFNTKDDEVLNGQTEKEVFYYLNENDALNRNNPIDKDNNFQNTSNPQTIYVRVENITDSECFAISNFSILVGTNPTFNEPTDLFVCDEMPNDTFTTVNLDEKEIEITSGSTQVLEVTFYSNLVDAEASTNALSSEYTSTLNPQEIYAVISSGNICSSITSFTINVLPVPTVSDIDPLIQCDADYDELTTWDLTDVEVNIQDVRQDNIVISYFESFEDAELDINAIPNPEDFTNTANPQTVYIKVEDTMFNCPVILPFDLITELPPAFNDFSIYEICDNQTNAFDLSIIDSIIVNDNSNTLIEYYSTQNDATNQTNILSTDYTYITNNDIIYIRLTDTNNTCFFVYPFMLVVNENPIATQPSNLVECDNDFDGFLNFDLLSQNTIILGNQDPNVIDITYHNSIDDANTNTNPLVSPYNAFDGQTIFVRATNSITSCFSTTQFNTIINPLPLTDIEDQAICPENFPLVVDADTGFSQDTYQWSTGVDTSEIEITEIGSYSVTVTTPNGCSVTSIFNVIQSEPANIEVVETVDFSDPNNVTVTISGIGDYLYQLDDFEPQTSNLFENVGLGYHTLTIIDLNGCASVTKEILVIDAPKFFTPNNDGDFDTWHISGVETLPGTIVYIFDRYGKLLKQLSYNSLGWDGTFNGNKMPATDYWFTADVKRGGIEFTVDGHFALRR